MASREDKEIPFESGIVELCYSEERVRIRFNDVPDSETRTRLKSSAFKWSPKNSAWQRQLTDNAIRATKRVLGIEF